MVQRRHRILIGLVRLGFVLSILVVCVLSLLPAEALPKFRLWDKISHMIAYAEIAVLGLLGFRGRQAALSIAIGVIALGGVLELAQQLVPGRSADLLDFLVNGLGVLVGYGVARLILRVWSRDRTPDPSGSTGH